MFILGIMPRCGTNFLSNLLIIHPDCAAPEQVWEDYTAAHLDRLAEYSHEVTSHWDSSWGVTDQTRELFDVALGKGIINFIATGKAGQTTVAKTPSVQNLDPFFRFFPDVPLLLLVRDGRAIVESGMRSFGWKREAALHWLAREAATLNAFNALYEYDQQRFRLIRYEDLWTETSKTMEGVLDFLGLDPATYDYEQASQLPVRGSSEILEQDKKALHWDPVEKPDAFDPLSRHKHWSGFMNYRYHQVAGAEMAAFGYPDANSGKTTVSWRVRSLVLDLIWALKKPLRPLYHRVTQKHSSKS